MARVVFLYPFLSLPPPPAFFGSRFFLWYWTLLSCLKLLLQFDQETCHWRDTRDDQFYLCLGTQPGYFQERPTPECSSQRAYIGQTCFQEKCVYTVAANMHDNWCNQWLIQFALNSIHLLIVSATPALLPCSILAITLWFIPHLFLPSSKDGSLRCPAPSFPL